MSGGEPSGETKGKLTKKRKEGGEGGERGKNARVNDDTPDRADDAEDVRAPVFSGVSMPTQSAISSHITPPPCAGRGRASLRTGGARTPASTSHAPQVWEQGGILRHGQGKGYGTLHRVAVQMVVSLR
jgi:hypothetical protein